MTNLTQEEINKNYEGTLIRLLDKLQEGMDLQNKKFGTRHGFVMMIIRDPTAGNVDIAHNFTESDDLINIMECALDTIKNGSDKQTLNP